MDQIEILQRIDEKIQRLGDSKRELEVQLARAREEMASLYKINKELLIQVEELNERNRELENSRSLQPVAQEDFRAATKQRINDLVKEIDECIALLNP